MTPWMALRLAELAAKSHAMRIISGVRNLPVSGRDPQPQKNYGVHVVALNMQDLEPLQKCLEQQKTNPCATR